MMRIAVVGAGAMGRLFGGRLAEAGHDVVFIDADRRAVEQLEEGGVVITTESGSRHVPASASLAADLQGEVDLVVLFTKSFHAEAAIGSVRHVVGRQTFGLSLQNGLGSAEALRSVFGENRVLVGTTDYPADLERPITVHSSDWGHVRLGALSGAGPAQRKAAEVAGALEAAGLRAVAETDIQVPIWEKVAFNAALNTLSAVTGFTVGRIGADPHARSLVDQVAAETIEVARSAGVPVSEERIRAALDGAYARNAEHKTSMLTDVEAGRRTEVDSIGGAVVRVGGSHGVESPVLETLCTLVRAAESDPARS